MALRGSTAATPEALHTNLTEVFLKADGDGSSYVSTPYPHPPIVREEGLVVRNVTHSFHQDYFDPRLNGAMFGVFAPRSTDSPNMYEERRQKRIYFLQAHQAFFELTANGSVFVIGNPEFHGPESLAVSFGSAESDSNSPDQIIAHGDGGLMIAPIGRGELARANELVAALI